MSTAKDFFSPAQIEQLTGAVREAESQTSGEIRIHIESKCKGEVLDRAAYIFHKLKMHETVLRNGILFYLTVSDRKFAMIGDKGIHAKVQDSYWDGLKEEMMKKFREEDIVSGLCFGILETGNQLRKYFPHQTDDVNELDDDISFGN